MIVRSAILKEGIIYTGHRHHDCIHEIVTRTGVRPAGGEQGFLTDEGRFLNRVEAVDHALKCGQIKEWKKRLYSEDLW